MLRPNRMWWSCSLEGVLALVSGETANALMNALEMIGNVARGCELLYNHRHGTLLIGFFQRVKFCCNAEMKSETGVNSCDQAHVWWSVEGRKHGSLHS